MKGLVAWSILAKKNNQIGRKVSAVYTHLGEIGVGWFSSLDECGLYTFPDAARFFWGEG